MPLYFLHFSLERAARSQNPTTLISIKFHTFCLLQNMGCLRTATVLGLTLASWQIILSTRDLQVMLSPSALSDK